MKVLQTVQSNFSPEIVALDPSDTIYSGSLTAGVEQTVTVPTGAQIVLFNADTDFFVNYDTTASVPSGTISQAGGELNPGYRYVGTTSVLHIISPYTCSITLAFYSKDG